MRVENEGQGTQKSSTIVSQWSPSVTLPSPNAAVRLRSTGPGSWNLMNRHGLEKLEAENDGSITKSASSGCGKTDVPLSGLKWLQAVMKSEAKVFWIIRSGLCWASTYIFALAVTSASWDEDGMISSFVGSALIVLIGRGLSKRTARHGWSNSSCSERPQYLTGTGSPSAGYLVLPLRFTGIEWGNARPGTSNGSQKGGPVFKQKV